MIPNWTFDLTFSTNQKPEKSNMADFLPFSTNQKTQGVYAN